MALTRTGSIPVSLSLAHFCINSYKQQVGNRTNIGLNHQGLPFVNLLCLDFDIRFQILKIQLFKTHIKTKNLISMMSKSHVSVTKFLNSHKLYYVNNKFIDSYINLLILYLFEDHVAFKLNNLLLLQSNQQNFQGKMKITNTSMTSCYSILQYLHHK